jgi:hypothetical protein
MIPMMLLACSQEEVTLDVEVTVPAYMLGDVVYPHRVVLGVDIPDTLSSQIFLGEICTAQSEDLVLTHSFTQPGCAQAGAVTAWLEPAGTDATCELEVGDWEPLTEPPQGAPQASADVFEALEKCRSGEAEVWMTLGYEE